MKRVLYVVTAPVWIPALAAWALASYVAGWIDWMCGGER